MFAALFRAAFLMVFMPYMVWLVIGEFAPNVSVNVPGVADIPLSGAAAFGMFLFGALVWAMNPTGKGGGGNGSGCDSGFDGGGDSGCSGCGGCGGD